MVNKRFSFNLSFPSFSCHYHQFDDSLSFFGNLNYFDLDICQLKAGKFYGNSVEINTSNVRIDRHMHSLLMKIQGAPVTNWAFAIPMLPLYLLFDHKYYLEDNYILLGPPESEFKLIQKSPYGVYMIYFNEAFFFDLCQAYDLPEPPELLGNSFSTSSVLICSRERLISLRRAINCFFEKVLIFLSFQARSDFIYSYFIGDIVAQLETKLLESLMFLIAESKQVKAKKVNLKRGAILHQAEEFINAYAKADISVTDICRVTGVSQRTLEYIFKDSYGLSPKTYLKQWRLNRFRRALREQGPSGDRVNEIGAEWGFWHSGQLARDYYHLFGELPSHTRKLTSEVIASPGTLFQAKHSDSMSCLFPPD